MFVVNPANKMKKYVVQVLQTQLNNSIEHYERKKNISAQSEKPSF